jgi:hypothetical protein
MRPPKWPQNVRPFEFSLALLFELLRYRLACGTRPHPHVAWKASLPYTPNKSVVKTDGSSPGSKFIQSIDIVVNYSRISASSLLPQRALLAKPYHGH